MSKRGYYLGGHTLVTRGSMWFSGERRSFDVNQLREAQLASESEEHLRQYPVAGAPIPGERERDQARVAKKLQKNKNARKRRFRKAQGSRLQWRS